MIRKEGKDMDVAGGGGREGEEGMESKREERLVTILRCHKEWKHETSEEKKKSLTV